MTGLDPKAMDCGIIYCRNDSFPNQHVAAPDNRERPILQEEPAEISYQAGHVKPAPHLNLSMPATRNRVLYLYFTSGIKEFA